MTSPPPIVPRAHQVCFAIVDLIALTEPSIMQTLTMPGCRLAALDAESLASETLPVLQLHVLGIMTCRYCPPVAKQVAQAAPWARPLLGSTVAVAVGGTAR